VSRGAPTAEELSFRRNLAGGVFALFAAGAGIAQVVGAPVWLKIAFSAIALIGAVLTIILLLIERSARAAKKHAEMVEAERVRSAVRIDVSHHGEDGYLFVGNTGLHVVHDIEVTAIPDDEDWMPMTHGSLPYIYSDTGPDVTLTAPIAGGWFYATVTKLSPGRGVSVVHYHDRMDDYQRIDIDVNWNDHDGRQRKAQVTGNLRECDGALSMTAREVQ
jgi:hypothetical protein